MALFVSVWDGNGLMLILILIVIGGIWAYLAYPRIHGWFRFKTARSWPSAEATVQSAAVAISVDGAKPEETVSAIRSIGVSPYLDAQHRMERYGPVIVWVIRAQYSFSVGSTYYGGYSDRWVSSEQAGAEYTQGLQGKKFLVRYKPGNPGTSVVMDDEWIAAIPSPSGSEGAHDPFNVWYG
jgi:hypothetical protein